MRLYLSAFFTTCCLIVPQVYAQDGQTTGTNSVSVINKEVSQPVLAQKSKEKKVPALVAKTHFSKEVQTAQKELHTLGYKVGHADGLMGRKTMASVKKYQKDHHLKTTGKVTSELVLDLEKTVNAKAKK
ncbi:peptidoglycan-binding domain-containing protein [Marinomonas sp. TI.3.20]|uniref:peptidoglycan-binding domain-containing protein n=1 Tax=Marinomonas sp. TI.3.20 TaxID=3121296 RepID=UPI00311E4291